MFIYLHGFNSSPASFKARASAQRLVERGLGVTFLAPALSHWPREAIATVESIFARHGAESITLIGSSLGGYYATWLAEQYGARAVLVNPAIRPYELMAAHLGAQTNPYTGAHYVLSAEHVDQLHALDVVQISRPERYLLLVAAQDEVLDSRVAMEKFRDSRQIVHAGGDHGFAAFTHYLDAVIDFGLR